MAQPEPAPGELFPAAPRVIYDHSPLQEVICQVRFPTVLRIQGEVPASFQERIRDRFPLFERQAPQFDGSMPAELAQIIGAAAQQATPYAFKTEDGRHTVALAPDFLSLTSTNYMKWEDFTAALTLVIEALHEVYRPSFYTRIGLRYRNALQAEPLGYEKTPWAKLLSPHIAGEFAAAAISTDYFVVEAKRQLRVMSMDQRYGVLLQHGLGSPSNPAGTFPYIIDTDVYTDERTEVTNALPVLKEFNRVAGRVFRWCITDDLHARLGPHPVGGSDEH